MVVSLLCLGAVGCTSLPPPEEDPVFLKLTDLEQRIDRMEQLLENQAMVDMVTQLQALESEVSELRGAVEVLQFDTDAAGRRQRDLYVDLDSRLNALERGAAGMEPATEGAAAAAPGNAFDSDRAAYQNAFELLAQKQYDEASAAFRGFVSEYPDSTLVDNAQYWLAESLYVESRFEEALAEFRKVVDDYPQSRKLADALLKVGYCEYELENWGAAREALNAVADGFADTTAARLARQRLERMASEGR